VQGVGRNSAVHSAARRGRICSRAPDDRRTWIPGEFSSSPWTRVPICSTPRIGRVCRFAGASLAVDSCRSV